jgi:hypothetical protein
MKLLHVLAQGLGRAEDLATVGALHEPLLVDVEALVLGQRGREAERLVAHVALVRLRAGVNAQVNLERHESIPCDRERDELTVLTLRSNPRLNPLPHVSQVCTAVREWFFMCARNEASFLRRLPHISHGAKCVLCTSRWLYICFLDLNSIEQMSQLKQRVSEKASTVATDRSSLLIESITGMNVFVVFQVAQVLELFVAVRAL